MLAYSRAFASGFGGALPFAHSADAAAVSEACSVARVAALLALTAAAWLLGREGAAGRRLSALLGCSDAPASPARADRARIPRVAAYALAVAVGAASLALVLDAGRGVRVAAAAVAGIGSGAAMLAYLVELARRAPRQIALAALGALLAGGLLIMALMRLDGPVAATLFLASGVGMCLVPGAGPAPRRRGEPSPPPAGAGPASRPAGPASAPPFPWMPILLFAASGIVGSMLYGTAVELGWNAGASPHYPLFGAAALTAVGATSLLVAQGGPLLQMAWIPQFALLLAAMVLASFADPSVNPTMLALLLASVFSYHFLRWMVFPALVSSSGAPRVLSCGIILIVTSSFLNVSTGEAVAQALPAGLQLQGGLVAVVALAFAIAFAAAFLVERLRRQMLVDQAPRAFEEALGEVIDAAVGEAFDAAVAQAAQARADEASAESGEDALGRRCAQLARDGGLTPREAEILGLTARGHSSTYIAGKLVISANTVRFHQKNIYRKLEVHDRQSLLAMVNRAGRS